MLAPGKEMRFLPSVGITANKYVTSFIPRFARDDKTARSGSCITTRPDDKTARSGSSITTRPDDKTARSGGSNTIRPG